MHSCCNGSSSCAIDAASNGGLAPLIMMMGPLCKTHPVAQTPRVHPCVQPLRFHHRAKPCVKEFWWKRRHPPLDKGSLDTSWSANRFLLWRGSLSVKSGWNGLMLIFFKLWWPWSLHCSDCSLIALIHLVPDPESQSNAVRSESSTSYQWQYWVLQTFKSWKSGAIRYISVINISNLRSPSSLSILLTLWFKFKLQWAAFCSSQVPGKIIGQ